MMDVSEKLKSIGTIHQLNVTLNDAVDVMRWQQLEIERLTAERDALKALIDKGVRVYAWNFEGVSIWANTNKKGAENATLLIDEDTNL